MDVGSEAINADLRATGSQHLRSFFHGIDGLGYGNPTIMNDIPYDGHIDPPLMGDNHIGGLIIQSLWKNKSHVLTMTNMDLPQFGAGPENLWLLFIRKFS